MALSQRTPLLGRIQLDRADRLQRLPVPTDADLDRIASRLRNRGVKIFDLSRRIIPSPKVSDVIPEIAATAHLGPAEEADTEALRESVTAWYQTRFGVRLKSDYEVEIAPSTSVAAALIALSFIDAGDMALLPDPGPRLYRTAVILAGGGVIDYPLLERNDYLPNLSAMENGLAGRLRLLVTVYPNDPTTAMGDAGMMSEVVAFGRKNNIIVLSEAGFAQAISDSTQPRSILEVRGARGAAVEFLPFDVAFGIPQLPLTAVVGNRDVIAALRFMIASARLRPSRPQLMAATSVLQRADEIIEARQARLNASRKILMDALANLPWRPRTSPTTPFIWVAVPSAVDTESLCRRLLRRTGIQVKPGTAMGERGEGFMRISIPEDERMARAVAERLESHARLYQRRVPRGRRSRKSSED